MQVLLAAKANIISLWDCNDYIVCILSTPKILCLVELLYKPDLEHLPPVWQGGSHNAEKILKGIVKKSS